MDLCQAEDLADHIKAASRASPLLHGMGLEYPRSRLQKLRTSNAWLKRDDELSFLMSGPKFRKVCGLSAVLREHDFIASWGSSRSAFLLALALQAKMLGKTLDLFLLESTPWQKKGADKLYKSAFAEHRLTFIKRSEWSNIRDSLPTNAYWIPEGGVGDDALLGAMSLGLDLAEQFERLDLKPQKVWIDAGTGLTAKALILSLGTLLADPPEVQVVLCAGDETSFEASLRSAHLRQAPYALHRPPTARSFGTTNQTIFATIDRYLREEGVLLDPIYTSKLLLAYEEVKGEGDIIIHSGGLLNNFGFD
jgi:1-aminocyclopropane-1-carboxylate deaminase